MNDLPQSVGTIGAGNMAEAILRGLLRAGLAAEALIASDTDPKRRSHMADVLRVRTTADNADVVRSSEVVVIAVKPAHVETALRGLPSTPSPLFVSIVAGKTLVSLRALLGGEPRLVRAMPNTPALVGAGITALALDPGTTDRDLDRAEAVLGAVGRVVRVPEAQLDAVTGLSGSGPAYVYRFAEALMQAGVQEGMNAKVAEELVIETILGAARLMRESGEEPSVLRARVTSPGGTTVAGLAALEAGGFETSVREAVRAAAARSRELAGKP